ncbi:YfhO family protein [Polaribacter uvawellassae]|uniref:YfhO family protein n=1 Tax=Polaribacter uvawellassae TaxID=3133495 RepID=UPI00321AA866
MKIKNTFPYIIAILIFVIASVLYFNPVLKGEKIKQSDITQFKGMSKEIADYRLEKGEEPYWTGSAFSGMPAYQLSAYYPNDYIKTLDSALRFLPRPADYVFLYFLGFFLLLTALNTEWELAILGALSFGFSTYLIIIFGAGHNAKAHAIAYMPMVMAGVIWIFKQKYLLGFIVTSIAMALEIYTNHPQMTYYLGFTLLILGIIKLIEAIQNKSYVPFIKQSVIIVFAMILGLGVNATRLLAMKEYASFSTRGKTELTIEPNGSPKQVTDGLSKEYITEYSYGLTETFNLFIPRFMGGGTYEKLGKNSSFYETLKSHPQIGPVQASQASKQVFTYWGDQTIIEAPAYIGAVLVFLFFLGAFLVKGTFKKWLVAATIFSIVLSWGKNFEIITNLFIDYVPLYNKFRAVSSIQVIAEICVPLLGILALKEFFSKEISLDEKKNALKKAFYILGGIAVFFILFGSSLFAFEGFRDNSYEQIPGLIEALISDRKAMLFQDSLRSLILISISFAILWFFLKNKMNQTKTIVGFAIIILFDLLSVNINYVNKDSFEKARNIEKPFQLNDIDKEILKDKSYYRVANFPSPLQDGRTSYFHNSIGGYHAAKMGRYQELFDYQIVKNNMEVLNMLNTKYFIFPDQTGNLSVQENPNTNGSVWFVSNLKLVTTADEEIKALDSLKTKHEAVIDTSKFDVKNNFERDSTARIKLTNYDVTALTYESNSTKNQFAVFSEIYYKDGWNAYVDGKLTPHYRVNYVLRGMEIPEGKHTIDFKFEPTTIKNGNTITLTSYFLLLIIPIGWFFVEKKRKKE